MAEQNVIDDVRDATAWVDGSAATLDELFANLRAVERAYLDRTGPYAAIPMQRSEAVQHIIDSAQDEPGRELLKEARSASR